MSSRNIRNSYRIARRAGQQGARPSTSGQAEVEKLSSDLPSQPAVAANPTESLSQQGPSTPERAGTNTDRRNTRQKWTREDYIEDEETLGHIVSGCEVLAKTEYISRHNNVAAYLHCSICKDHDIEITDKWYQHAPETVMHNKDNNITIMWDMPVNTDRTNSEQTRHHC